MSSETCCNCYRLNATNGTLVCDVCQSEAAYRHGGADGVRYIDASEGLSAELFGKKRQEKPSDFFIELKALCAKYGAAISGSEWGVHIYVAGSGMWHTGEVFDEKLKQIDNMELP